ncbi:MAG: hypothetical protein ABI852_19900, partial [Gemmatimonadaceae bacterium]
NSDSRSVTITANQAPTAVITSPANGTSVVQGTSISFSGTGNDPEDGSLGGASLTWSSNVSGTLGTGASLSTSALSVGTHTITLSVKDSKNAAGSASISITVTAAPAVNQKPVVTVLTPSAGFTAKAGTPVTFTGSALDPEDGAITGANVLWTITYGGGRALGYGTTLTVSNLPVGTYTFAMLARDSKLSIGTSGPISITITP